MARTTSAVITDLEGISKVEFEGKKVVLVGGSFDLIHEGHIAHLKEASELGDILIVHVTGDDRIREKKGSGRPILSENVRAKIIAAVRYVDCVFIYNGRHYDKEVLEKVQPDIFYINKEGSQDALAHIKNSLKNFSGTVFISELPKIDSSSDIIKRGKRALDLF